MTYPNLFKNRYPVLTGKNWLLQCSKEDIQAFARLGFELSGYGRSGGHARASTALRDNRGRFISNRSSEVKCSVCE
jgi:hypothetical protein